MSVLNQHEIRKQKRKGSKTRPAFLPHPAEFTMSCLANSYAVSFKILQPDSLA